MGKCGNEAKEKCGDEGAVLQKANLSKSAHGHSSNHQCGDITSKTSNSWKMLLCI